MPDTPFSILLIDDEAAQRKSLSAFLKRRGFDVHVAESGQMGLEVAREHTIDLTITDYRMPGWNGLEALRQLKLLNPEIEVVVLTAFGNIEDAVAIMKAGAYDYLTKPVDLEELLAVIGRVREKRHLVAENKRLKARIAERFHFDAIVSGSSAMEDVLSMASRVAETDATVLIRGPSGTGKELVAQAIHQASRRADQPFETIHVAALNENLVESELFGHEKGAFTGATERKIGRLERADGGTVFFDEVGDIPPGIQVKLLRAIQFGQFERVGGTDPVKVDVRLLAATHQNLDAMVAEGSFREDLYYRLNVVTLWIPALKQRKSDIPLLCDHFIGQFNKRYGKDISGLSREAMDQLMKYDFPGNVRELQNMLERAIVLTREGHITVQDLPLHARTGSVSSLPDPTDLEGGYRKKMDDFEQVMLDAALERAGGNQSEAARLLHMSERKLRYRLERRESGKGSE